MCINVFQYFALSPDEFGIHYLQLAGTYHILNEHLKSMLGTINQYKMYYNFHETDAFSREMAFSLQAAACPTCTA